MLKKVSFKHYAKNILIGLDQFGNTLTGGDPDETISSRLGKCHRGDYGRTLYIITYLPWLFTNCLFYVFDGWGHCSQSIEDDEGKEDLLK